MRPDLVEEAVHFEGLLVSSVSWCQPLILAHSASWPPWDQQLGSATPFCHDGLPQHRLRHRTKCSWVETSERMSQNNTPFKWLLSGIFSQHYEASPCPNIHCVCPRDNFPFSEVIWSRENGCWVHSPVSLALCNLSIIQRTQFLNILVSFCAKNLYWLPSPTNKLQTP